MQNELRTISIFSESNMNILILISHPIQYLVPFFRELSRTKGINLKVLYTWNFGVESTFDKQFGREVKWDIPLLEGYRYAFLKNRSPKPSSDFWGQINFGIVCELKKEKPDALLVFGWNGFTNWLAFFTAFTAGIKVFLRGESPLNQELMKPAWKRFLKGFILRPLFSEITKFFYIGSENKKFYEHYGVPEEKLVFVPYAVNNERFMSTSKLLKANRKELREKLLRINDNSPVILFVGKLIKKKRPMDLLKAFEILNTKYDIHNTALVFVGDGELRPTLEKYTKEHKLNGVHFTGFKNQTELPQHYTVADLFVLPSGPGETWGLVVNEAMCFGLPVVVSDVVGCAPDLVHNGENGYIFPAGNVEKLSEVLKKILEQDKEKLGAESFKIVGRYSFQKGAEEILDIMERR